MRVGVPDALINRAMSSLRLRRGFGVQLLDALHCRSCRSDFKHARGGPDVRKLTAPRRMLRPGSILVVCNTGGRVGRFLQDIKVGIG